MLCCQHLVSYNLWMDGSKLCAWSMGTRVEACGGTSYHSLARISLYFEKNCLQDRLFFSQGRDSVIEELGT